MRGVTRLAFLVASSTIGVILQSSCSTGCQTFASTSKAVAVGVAMPSTCVGETATGNSRFAVPDFDGFVWHQVEGPSGVSIGCNGYEGGTMQLLPNGHMVYRDNRGVTLTFQRSSDGFHVCE